MLVKTETDTLKTPAQSIAVYFIAISVNFKTITVKFST